MILPRKARTARTAVTATIRRSLVRLLTRMAAVDVTRTIAVASMRTLFNSIAPSWENIRSEPIYREATRAALAELPHRVDTWRVPARALDVACGTGLATQLLLESFPAASVTGIDIAEEMLDLARELVPDAMFVAADSFALPFEDDSWDLVITVDGVFDTEELARVCAPGGSIVIVYTKGASIPVSRDVHEIATQLEATGMHCSTYTDSFWCVWASQPAISPPQD